MPGSLMMLVILAWADPSDTGPVPPGLAARGWAITDAVLARHVDPPARQQMLLGGLKALHSAAKVPVPADLARRASGVEAVEQLGGLLARSWPGRLPEEVGRSAEAVFVDGLLAAVPGGAELRSARERKVDEQVAGNVYVGIQVALAGGPEPALHLILPGGPAERAGARVGDVIEAVDGAPTRGMPMPEILARIRGEAGTPVVIRLRRKDSGASEDLEMTRDRLPRVTVEGLRPRDGGGWEVRLDRDSRVGYLKVKEIVGSTVQEIRAFAAQLEEEGARALVLDFRGLGQATLHPTILLADALLDGGTIGRVREGDAERVVRAQPDALFRGWPMAVLTDQSRSPEAAWLVAALEDNHRAIPVGRAEAGPAVVRSAVELPGGEWSVAMATGRLFRGDGKPLAEPLATLRRRPGPGGPAEPGLRADDPDAVIPADPPAPSRSSRTPGGRLGFAPPDPLAFARTLLEAAIKVAGP